MFTLKTQSAVALIHEAGEFLPKLDKSQRAELEWQIASLVSVVVLYLRVRQPEVPEAHWRSYADLFDRVAQLKEHQ